MPRVKKAIIMAGGKGTRLAPLTFVTPKPLVKVRGQAMVETTIEALLTNGIQDIVVVTGHLAEAFADLPRRYSQVKLVHNPDYGRTNNISSLYCVREFLDCDLMILDGDQLICAPRVLHADFDVSGYTCAATDAQNEWFLQLDSQQQVQFCSKQPCFRGQRLYSISRWTKADAKKLAAHLEEDFNQRGLDQIYWDDIVLFNHFTDYQLRGYPINGTEVLEIDNFEQLCQVDPRYRRQDDVREA